MIRGGIDMMTSEWMKIILYLERNTKGNNLENLNQDQAKNLYRQLKEGKKECHIK